MPNHVAGSAGSTRTGVVLAAGFGSRLAGADSSTKLKPLTPVAGRPLMLRTLDSLGTAGCTQAVIVLGFEGDVVRSQIESAYAGDLAIEFVTNSQYQLSNGLSVVAAAEHVTDRFLLTMADHVFGDSVMRIAGSNDPPANGATLLVDRKLDAIFDMDDATKVQARGSRIVSIGKQLTEFNCVDTGLFICSRGLISALEEVYRETGDASLSDGVTRLSRGGRMTALDIGDGFWQDVDTPEMLAEAERWLNG